MPKPFDNGPEWESTREKLMGLGETSTRKSYYPELQKRVRELQASEERFRTIFDHVNDAILVHDSATGSILNVNQRASEMFGYSREELLQRNVGNLSSGVPPYTLENALELIKKAADGEPQVVEWQVKHKSGRVLWVEANLRRAYIDSKERVLAVVRDVTERHEAELALRHSESRYRSVVDYIPAGVVVHSDFIIRFVNQASVEAANVESAADMIGRPIWDFIHPDLHDAYRARYLRLLRGETQTTLTEGRLIDANGKVIDIEGTATKIPFDGEEAILSMFRDVTQRKEAEEALQKSEERLSLTLNATTEGIYDWNIVTGEVLFSPSWYRSLGYDPSEISPEVSSWENLVHPDDQPLVRQTLEDHLAGKTPVFEQEYRIRKSDGTYRWSMDRGKVVKRDADGRPLRMVGSDTDITERKQAEEDRKALETHKRTFYRETILSVTNGKLEICDSAEIETYLANAQVVTGVSDKSDVSPARKLVEEMCTKFGLDEGQLKTFILGCGEAITNAIKHAPEGLVYTGHTQDDVWVAIVDNGPGMESLILPRAVLRRGFSTKTSMGFGYSIMLDVADHIMLKTDSSGTSVVLIKKKHPIEESLLILPDTWDSIPSEMPQ